MSEADDTEQYILIHSSRQVHVTIDGTVVGDAPANVFQRFSVFAGVHRVRCETPDAAYAWQGDVRVPVSEQIIVEPDLRPSDPTIGWHSTFEDPRDRNVYRTVTILGREWLAQNIRFKLPDSRPPGGKEGFTAEYGRLYYPATIGALPPPGWRLPTMAEYRALIASYANPFADLSAGGRSGFDVLLAGGWALGKPSVFKQSTFLMTSDKGTNRHPTSGKVHPTTKGITFWKGKVTEGWLYDVPWHPGSVRLIRT